MKGDSPSSCTAIVRHGRAGTPQTLLIHKSTSLALMPSGTGTTKRALNIRTVIQVTAGAFATAGLRGEDRMEDRHVIQEGLASCSGCHLLAVFDGHRGSDAAEYAAQHIVQQLQETLAASDSAEAIADTFF